MARGFENSRFTSVCVDKGDNVWVGTQNRGLLRFSNAQDWTEYNTSNGLTSDKIFKILSDSKGNVYALMDRDISVSPRSATLTGTASTGRSESILDVAILEGDSWKKLDVPWGNREYFWRESAIIDNEDNLWVALDAKPGNGLYRFDGATWEVFRPDSSWLNGWIWEIAADKDSNLWTAYELIDKVTLREPPIEYPSRARILLLILPALAIGTGGVYFNREWKRSPGYIARVTYHSEIAPSPHKLYILLYSLMRSFQEARVLVHLAKHARADGDEDIAKRISVFSTLMDHSADLGDVLREASEAFAVERAASSLRYEWGEEIYSQYQLLLTAYSVKTVSQITAFANNLQTEVEGLKQLDDYILKDSVEALDMLGKVADTIRKYERVGLPEDQVVYLNSGITQIEQMQRFVQKHLSMPDRRIFEQIAANWRNIVGNTLTELQSTAKINAELKGKEAPLRDEVTAILQLTNIGRGHADDLIVRLAPSDEYDAIDSEKDVGTILQGRYAQVEFRISPRVSSEDAKERAQIRVAFHIQYNDQRRAGNTQEFADTFTLRAIEKREFVELSPNPYIVGKPVREGELFFGREEDFQYIRQNLRGEYRDNIIILHGQRRTGKTSILYQLRELLSDEYIPVLIDMQGMLDEGTDAFLYNIATQIYRAMRDGSAGIPRPRVSDFREQPGTYFRDEFLEQVQQNNNGKSLILMFDEFELLEERVNEGKLDGSIFEYLRNLMQHGDGINFIFSGTHKLEEMSSDYWSTLFNIALYRKVTFLEREDAEELIILPVKDYFDYDPLAIEKMIRTTAGHPHFTQLLCHALVNHRNRKKINYITVQDVTDVIDEVAETGQIHIEYIWRESSSDAKMFLVALNNVLNREGIATLSRITDLLEEYNIEIDLPSAIESLSNRDVIEVESGHYRFMIDLVRYWVNKSKSMQGVIEEVRGNG